MELKEFIEQALREECLLPEDAEGVFRVMGKILYEVAQRTKASEPHATVSIRQYEQFSSMVDDYEYFLQQHS